jgi:hypothetical protein
MHGATYLQSALLYPIRSTTTQKEELISRTDYSISVMINRHVAIFLPQHLFLNLLLMSEINKIIIHIESPHCLDLNWQDAAAARVALVPKNKIRMESYSWTDILMNHGPTQGFVNVFSNRKYATNQVVFYFRLTTDTDCIPINSNVAIHIQMRLNMNSIRYNDILIKGFP